MKPPPLSSPGSLVATRPRAKTPTRARRPSGSDTRTDRSPRTCPSPEAPLAMSGILRAYNDILQRRHGRLQGAPDTMSNARERTSAGGVVVRRTAASKSVSSGPPAAPSGGCPRAASRPARATPDRRPRGGRRDGHRRRGGAGDRRHRLLVLLAPGRRPHPQDRPLLPRPRRRRRHRAPRPRSERGALDDPGRRPRRR